MPTRTKIFALGTALLAITLLALPARSQQPTPPGFKNLKVLPPTILQPELAAIMKAQKKALGVECTFCHVEGDASKDDKSQKLRAREMIKMTQNLNATTFKDSKVKIACWTCHRGKKEVPVPPPA